MAQQRRLFFGIPLSSASKRRLVKEMKGWEDLPLFVAPQVNLHATIFFLGFVDDIDIADISARAEEAASICGPFDMEFSEINLAPEGKEASMIWMTGEPCEGALALRNAFDRAFAGKHADNKRFRPHVTLARLRKNLWNKLEAKPSFPREVFMSESVASVALFESVSEGGKRKFLVIDEYPLGIVD
jgi:2'-5' RNA ligase